MARKSAEPSPPGELAEAPRRRGPDPARVIAALVLLGFAIAFVVQNQQKVQIHLWFVTVHMTLVWVVVVAFVAGVVVEMLLRRAIRNRWRARREGSRRERAPQR